MDEDQEMTELRTLQKSCNDIGGAFIATARKETRTEIATGYAIVGALAFAVSTIVGDQVNLHEERNKA